MSMEEIFRAFVMSKAGHHQDHSVGKIDVMRSDNGMKQLQHWDKDWLRRAIGRGPRTRLQHPAPNLFWQNVKSSHDFLIQFSGVSESLKSQRHGLALLAAVICAADLKGRAGPLSLRAESCTARCTGISCWYIKHAAHGVWSLSS